MAQHQAAIRAATGSSALPGQNEQLVQLHTNRHIAHGCGLTYSQCFGLALVGCARQPSAPKWVVLAAQSFVHNSPEFSRLFGVI
jgi:hypothetical protein